MEGLISIMEVVPISKKSQKTSKKIKSKATLYPSNTKLKNLTNINLATRSSTTYRVLVLLDGINVSKTLYGVGTEYFHEKLLHEIISLFLNKYPAKILYALNEVEVSGYHELRNLINLGNMTLIRKHIQRFEEIGVMNDLSKKDSDYKIINTFWRNEYPNTHKNIKLFRLIPKFRDIIEIYKDKLLRTYITAKEFDRISKRRNRFMIHKKVVKGQLKALKIDEGKKLGICMVCGAAISKLGSRGKDYHIYPGGMTCWRCNKKATIEQKLEWIHSNK